MSRWYDVDQGSDDWAKLRLGVPTSSCFDRIITPSRHEFSASAIAYAGELIDERLSNCLPPRVENYTTRAMRDGQQNEEEACRAYSLMTGLEIAPGGFFMTFDDRQFQMSPDRRVLTDAGTVCGATEMKCPMGKTHMKWLLGPDPDKSAQARARWEANNRLPLDHLCQVHGELIVTGLPWVDFFSYASGSPDILIRVVPNAFTMKMRIALERFWKLYLQVLGDMAKTGTEKIKALYAEKSALGVDS